MGISHALRVEQEDFGQFVLESLSRARERESVAASSASLLLSLQRCLCPGLITRPTVTAVDTVQATNAHIVFEIDNHAVGVGGRSRACCCGSGSS